MPHHFTIRRADPADYETLADLRVAFLAEIASHTTLEQQAATRQSLRAYLNASLLSGAFLAWLAEIDGKIIGTSGLVFFRKPPSFNNPTGVDAYIMNMYTVPEWRGCGIATALLSEILAYVRTTDASAAVLHATEAGRPLYAKFGFVGNDDEMELSLRRP